MDIYTVTIMVFLGVAGVAFFLMYLVFPARTATLVDRLHIISEEAEAGAKPVHLLKKPAGPWQIFLEKIGSKVPMRPEDYGKYRAMLVSAGLRGEMLPVYLGLKITIAAALPALYLLFYGIPLERNSSIVLLVSIFLLVLGYLAPGYGLAVMTKNRKLKIFHALPDILDLMTVCVESGLSIDSAMLRIAGDKQYDKNPLAKEMKQAVQETRAGKSREDALRDMGWRSKEDDLKSFSAMLIQTERLGTSLAESLRIHSDSLRTKRRQLAEEEAAKTTIKLLFPLVFLLFPAIFIVILLPALIRMARVFSEIF